MNNYYELYLRARARLSGVENKLSQAVKHIKRLGDQVTDLESLCTLNDIYIEKLETRLHELVAKQPRNNVRQRIEDVVMQRETGQVNPGCLKTPVSNS